MKIYDFNDNKQIYGKKGDVLCELYHLSLKMNSFKVPQTLVLSTMFFEEKIKNRISKNLPILTCEEKNIILSTVRRVFQGKRLIVRSSASCEDSILFTNSGQFDSFVNLSSDEDIIKAIELTYQSFFSKNSQLYSEKYDYDLNQNSMAVLIQEMAPISKAGVMFTHNPVSAAAEPVVEWVYGLGEKVVSGQNDIDSITNTKAYPEFKALCDVGYEIFKHYGIPQDIEWGITDEGEVYILQSRPIVFNHKPSEKYHSYSVDGCVSCGVVSTGFTIACLNDNNIMLQNGKFTAKDLPDIMNSSAIVLTTGGILSHFANIIREFKKPAVSTKQTLKQDVNYVIDAYEGKMFEFKNLTEDQKITIFWNVMVDYLNKIEQDDKNVLRYAFGVDKNSKQSFIVDGSKIQMQDGKDTLIVHFKNDLCCEQFVKKCLILKEI